MNILFFLGTYLLVVLFYFFYLRLYRINKEYNTMSEVVFLKNHFNLNNTVNERKLTLLCVNVNAFIIAFTGFVVYLIPVRFIFQMIIGFAILVVLIFGLYELIGRVILKKKRVKRNV